MPRLKNSKRKGSRNEHRSMKWLEARGYRCTRAAASLGEWDIVGVGSEDVVLVQVKSNRPPGKAEMDRMKRFEIPQTGVLKFLHIWKDRVKEPVVVGLGGVATYYEDTFETW